jgi:hypothetical protein
MVSFGQLHVASHDSLQTHVSEVASQIVPDGQVQFSLLAHDPILEQITDAPPLGRSGLGVGLSVGLAGVVGVGLSVGLGVGLSVGLAGVLAGVLGVSFPLKTTKYNTIPRTTTPTKAPKPIPIVFVLKLPNTPLPPTPTFGVDLIIYYKDFLNLINFFSIYQKKFIKFVKLQYRIWN